MSSHPPVLPLVPAKKPRGLRADVLTVQQNLAATRSRAQALILAGAVVRDNGVRVNKAGELLPADCTLQLKGQPNPYVSRGGLKLQAALQHFAVHGGLSVQDALCLDVGASTGGFTDCLLQHGAAQVVALDVGYNQLAYSLRQHPQVVVIERLNIRHATREQLPQPFDVVVIDVSFISLRTVLPTLLPFVRPGTHLVALVKPQFEVGRGNVGKSGVVRDAAARDAVLKTISEQATRLGLMDVAAINSPIVGAKGNHEFLLHGVFAHSGPEGTKMP
jgi:23S rRNA (cytidine1920-2'-O)/16S rRNA (cytidine1409-2'-O)-methyltransferase